MMIQTKQIDKHFPELDGIPLDEKEKIVEMARYQIYMTKGGRRKFIQPYIYSAISRALSLQW